MSMTAIGLTRVSTQGQAESGLGVDAQRAAIEKCARDLSLEVSAWFSDDGVSGAAPIEKRLGLLSAIRAVNKGDVLIVAKRDRLARDPMVAACCEIEVGRRGGRIVSASGEGSEEKGPAGKLLRGILDLVAEFERAMISARTKGAKAAARVRGDHIGGLIPYGKRLEGDKLVDDQNEQEAIRLARQLRETGVSFARVGKELLERGHRPRRAKKWHVTQVQRMCR